ATCNDEAKRAQRPNTTDVRAAHALRAAAADPTAVGRTKGRPTACAARRIRGISVRGTVPGWTTTSEAPPRRARNHAGVTVAARTGGTAKAQSPCGDPGAEDAAVPPADPESTPAAARARTATATPTTPSLR